MKAKHPFCFKGQFTKFIGAHIYSRTQTLKLFDTPAALERHVRPQFLNDGHYSNTSFSFSAKGEIENGFCENGDVGSLLICFGFI